MEIFYWSDYACPYCYIGETNLKAALRELEIDCMPVMRAFELSPDAPRSCPGPTKNLVARKYGLTGEQAEAGMGRINQMAAEAGLEEAEVRALLSSDDYAGEVRADEETAHRYGVTGVPYFVIDGQFAIPGALGKAEMVGVLQKILDRRVG